MNNEPKQQELVKQQLLKDSHADHPSLSAAVAILIHPVKGRDLVAHEDIPAGALLIEEAPFTYALFDECVNEHCAGCLSALPSDTEVIVRCERCKDAKTQYCTVLCRSLHAPMHEHECPIMCLLHNLQVPAHSLLLAIRAMTRLTPQSLILVCQQMDCPPELGPTPISTHTVQDQYQLIMTLTKSAQISNEDSKYVEFIDKVTKPFLSREGWPADFCLADKQVVLRKNLLGLLQRLPRNRQGIWQQQVVRGDGDRHQASGLYPCQALLNHSCLPNISVSFTRYGVLEARATRAIQKGHSLDHCYGARMGQSSRQQRQQQLIRDYQFTCECQACAHPKYREIEDEMTAGLCVQCGTILLNAQTDCLCGVKAPDPDKFIKSLLAVLLKPVADKELIVDSYNELALNLHQHNVQLNQIRLLVAEKLLTIGESSTALSIFRAHLVTVKRHYGADSLWTAEAMSKVDLFGTLHYYGTLDGVRSIIIKVCGTARSCHPELYWLTATAMLHIYKCHYGTERLSSLLTQSNTHPALLKLLTVMNREQPDI